MRNAHFDMLPLGAFEHCGNGRIKLYGPAKAVTSFVSDTVSSIGNVISDAGSFIDDLVMFHDLIALLACKHYMIKDFATNPVLIGQMEMRIKALNEYLSTGRNFSGNNGVIGSDELTYLGY